MKYINDAEQLKKFIGRLHEAPQAPAPAAPPPAASTDEAAQTPQQQGVSISNVSGEQPPAPGHKQQKITLSMVIEKLNSIRSGHSLKDTDILQQMQQYFHDLNDTERLALYAFLKGIAQVVTGEISGQAATGPSDAPPAVEMQPASAPAAPPAAPAAPKTEAPAPQQALPAAQATPAPAAQPSGQKVRTIKPTIVRRTPSPIKPKAR